jgi:transposase
VFEFVKTCSRGHRKEQLDFEPARLKVIVHKRAVYACPEKHDEATLITAPKPPQPVEKGLATSGSAGSDGRRKVR